jgi:hypothetical protein
MIQIFKYNSNLLKLRLNLLFNIIFIIEMAFKIYAFGPKGYITDRLNQFDCIIVSLTIVDMGIYIKKAFSSSAKF